MVSLAVLLLTDHREGRKHHPVFTIRISEPLHVYWYLVLFTRLHTCLGISGHPKKCMPFLRLWLPTLQTKHPVGAVSFQSTGQRNASWALFWASPRPYS